MDLSAPRIETVTKLVADRVIDAKYARPCLKIYPGAETYRRIVHVLTVAVVLIPSCLSEKYNIAVFGK